MEFEPFEKIPRLSRECTITEKIDGTNGCIYIGEAGWIEKVALSTQPEGNEGRGK